MKFIGIMSVIVVGVSATMLRNTKLRKLVGITSDFIKNGQPTNLYAAGSRWPTMAKNGRKNGKGRNAPYLINKEEYPENLEAFRTTASDSEKRMAKEWFDLIKNDDGILPANYVSEFCVVLTSQLCEWDNEPQTLEEFQAALGAGYRSIKDSKMNAKDIRPLFENRDANGDGKITPDEDMRIFYQLAGLVKAAGIEKADEGITEFQDSNVIHLVNKAPGLGKGMSFGQWAKYWYGAQVDEKD